MQRFLLVLLATFITAAAEAKRPNILYFYVDDLGWGSIGPNGQAKRRAEGLPSVQTPNLDRLAAEGLNFTRGYGCYVCSPARSSQQTGFHQGHTFADRNDPDNAKKAMRREDVTMGDALSAAGYATGYWGKWGFGGTKDQSDPQVVNVQTLPTSHGYDHVLAELHHVRAHTFFQPTLWKESADSNSRGGITLVPNTLTSFRGKASYPDLPARQNHADYPATAYCDDSYAFAALDFVRHQARQFRTTGQPFFGLLAVQIPHAPFDEITQLPDWDAAYADDAHFDSLAPQSRQWAAMVTRIDAHFGNILAALEDPNGDGDQSDSVVDDTLVIFQSDNGGPRGSCLNELDSNGGLRGTKGTIYEGGIRVPLVMRWPAEINDRSPLKAGSDCDRVVDVTDLLPTFCELADVETPLGVDGVSIAPLLRGEDSPRIREFIIHEAGKQASIIRGKHKLIRDARGNLELYDLSQRPNELEESPLDPKLIDDLETLLLGERVTEEKGFSVTYHHWTGRDGNKASNPAHWSDYQYANEGITYQVDDGAPCAAWIATMINSGSDDNTAVADTDLQFLALEIRGSKGGRQALVLDPRRHVTGRNEIRIGASGTLNMNGGRISSFRWVDIRKGGTLQGGGDVEATVHNAGRVVVDSPKGQIRVAGDYLQEDGAKLIVSLQGDVPAVEIVGTATLGGTLSLVTVKASDIQPGESMTLLRAEQIVGRFDHPDDIVVTQDGRPCQVEYTPTTVSIVLK